MGVAKSMTLRGGGPTLSVTMTLIFPKIVWTCPLKQGKVLESCNTSTCLPVAGFLLPVNTINAPASANVNE